jgi:hypothetical protein
VPIWKWEKDVLITSRSIVVALFMVMSTSLLIHALDKQTSVSPREQELADAREALKKNPHDPKAQEQYLNAFPHNYKEFVAFFVDGHNFSDGFDVIMLLASLAENHADELGKLLVELSRDAKWDADAPNYLQQVTTIYAGQHAKTFASLIKQLPPKDHANLITFLADKENHAAYTEYQEMIDRLRSIGQDRLAKEFEVAREKRVRQPHG